MQLLVVKSAQAAAADPGKACKIKRKYSLVIFKIEDVSILLGVNEVNNYEG